jgi:hypothetical protein
MLTKTNIVLAAALILGVASAAQAGGRDDADQSGGYRLGPLGQSAASGVNPVDHRSLARGAFASTARVPVAAGKNAEGYTWAPAAREPAYMAIQDKFYRDSQ